MPIRYRWWVFIQPRCGTDARCRRSGPIQRLRRLLWVHGDTAFAALDAQGQLLPYTPSAPLNAVGKELTPKNHYYVPVSTTVWRR